MSIRKLAARLKTAAPQGVSFALSGNIPGTPFVINGWENKEERFPGMRRWVDRRQLERAMRAHDTGISQEDFVDAESSGGLGRDMLLGAGLTAPSATILSQLMGRTGLLPARAANAVLRNPLSVLLGSALLGAGGGALHHLRDSDRRRESANEAYLGAAGEVAEYPRLRTALPQSRHDESSASAVTPVLLSTAPSVT